LRVHHRAILVAIMVIVAGCTVSKQVPSGWPRALPVMEGMRVYQSESSDRMMYISICGDAGAREAMLYYTHLEGWDSPVEVTNDSGTLSFTLTRGGERVDVAVFRSYGDSDQLQTHVKLIYMW